MHVYDHVYNFVSSLYLRRYKAKVSRKIDSAWDAQRDYNATEIVFL